MSTIEREVQSVPEVLTEREQRARTFEAAALEIEVRGWTQGTPCSKDGRVCLFGGMMYALGMTPDYYDGPYPAFPVGFFDHAVKAWGAGQWGNGTPLAWNDTDGRTVEQVTFLLRWRAQEIRDGR